MLEEMEFDEVKVILNAQFNENILIVMKLFECFLHTLNSFRGMHWKLGNIDKVKKPTCCSDETNGGLATWKRHIDD